jgi:hypothetical protein
MSSSDPSKALLMQHFLKDLTIMLSGVAFHATGTHRATSEGAARKGRLKERCGLEPRNNFFWFKKSAKTSGMYMKKFSVKEPTCPNKDILKKLKALYTQTFLTFWTRYALRDLNNITLN